jgi:pimeloyl-ACP methyl ester carboxylesterase
VHGWGARATEMAPFVVPLLQRGYRVLAFDGPAHGASQGEQVDFIQFAEATALAAQGPLAGVIAHSYGAACLLIACTRFGLKAERMVLLGCPASAVWVTEDFGRRMSVPDPVLRHMRQLLVRRRRERWTWEEVGAEELVGSLGIAPLLIHDVEDVVIPFEHATRIAAKSPRSELVQVRGLGHRRMLRNGEVVLRCIQQVAPCATVNTVPPEVSKGFSECDRFNSSNQGE